MVALDINQVSIISTVLGGFIVSFGLVSYVVKERLFFSEALVAVLVGIIFGPKVIDVSEPDSYGNAEDILHQFTRIVIAIQVMLAGVSLPKAYLIREWKSLAILLGPVMIWMWLASSLILWAMIPALSFIEAMIIASCVTPTDPVLSAGVLKGRFANKYVPPHVRNIILAESGANDGLGYPFLFFAVYLLRKPDGAAIGEWVYDVILYQILLSVVIGMVIGFIARKTLYYSEKNKLCDKESFLVYAIALALFTMGFTGMIGSDDLLACFFAGNSFTWDDWFRVETQDESLQDVIDMLLNLTVFVYIGAIIPWDFFTNASIGVTPWRLVIISLLILVFRRLPVVLALYKGIPAVVTWREAIFAGWFGPIGVGALFYLTVGIEALPGDQNAQLRDLLRTTVFFIVLASICVHGLTLPVYKLTAKGIQTTRSFTRGLSRDNPDNLVARLPQLRFGQPLSFTRTDTGQGQRGSKITDQKRDMAADRDLEEATSQTLAKPAPVYESGTSTPTPSLVPPPKTLLDRVLQHEKNAPRPSFSRSNSLSHIQFEDEVPSRDKAGEQRGRSHIQLEDEVNSNSLLKVPNQVNNEEDNENPSQNEIESVSIEIPLQTQEDEEEIAQTGENQSNQNTLVNNSEGDVEISENIKGSKIEVHESQKNSNEDDIVKERNGHKHHTRLSYSEGDIEISEDSQGSDIEVYPSQKKSNDGGKGKQKAIDSIE